MPDRLYDDAEELARWARDAHAVALRKAAGKPEPRAAKRAVYPASGHYVPPSGRYVPPSGVVCASVPRSKENALNF